MEPNHLSGEKLGNMIDRSNGSIQKTFGQGRVQANVIVVDGKYGNR